MATLGVVANLYNEAQALPGWLENVTSFADAVSVYHSGPQGAESDDGTIEILEQWKIPIHRGPIDAGFGICRNAAIRSSPCDWVMVMDVDERFQPKARVLRCTGESTPGDEAASILGRYTSLGQWPCWEEVGRLGSGLHVEVGEEYDQIGYLRSIINGGLFDVVSTVRRHWHDLTWTRPTQNWHLIPDYQSRIVRNIDRIHFDPSIKMHERLRGARSIYRANQSQGPFFEHAHFYYKAMDCAGRAHAVAVYTALHEGRTPPKKAQYLAGQR